MPNAVGQRLNTNVQATFSAAELNGANRAFIGITIKNLAEQRVLINGLLWSVFPFAAGDKAFILLSIFIQRGLALDTSTPFGASENHDEQIFNWQPDGRFDSLSDRFLFTQPIVLEGGYNWGIVVEIIMIGGAATAAAIATLSALGVQVSGNNEPFPYNLR